MPLFKASFETLYVKKDPTGFGTVGHRYGRRHDIVIEAKNLKVAAEDALRFLRNRQATEVSMIEMYKDEPDNTYEVYWGDLGAMKIWPWTPHVVQPDGNLGEARGYAGRGMFEWKCDYPFPIEKEIEIIGVADEVTKDDQIDALSEGAMVTVRVPFVKHQEDATRSIWVAGIQSEAEVGRKDIVSIG